MKIRKILVFISVICLISCNDSSDKSPQISDSSKCDNIKFDEEFVDGSTVGKYVEEELFLFDNAVTYRPMGMKEEDYIDYRTLFVSPFQNKQIYDDSQLIEYRYRDYYSVFYYKDNLFKIAGITRDVILDDDQDFIGLPINILYNLRNEHSEEPYSAYFKFLNVDNLDNIPFVFENFYAYNVLHLIDLYDESGGYLNTTFDFKLFTINESNEMCFYDVSRGVKNYGYDIKFNEKNSYFAYYNYERYKDMKLIPYLPHPYWHDTPMMTRIEVDDKYGYVPLFNNQIREGELLIDEKTILQYDADQHKSIEKTITCYYAKIAIEDLVPVV